MRMARIAVASLSAAAVLRCGGPAADDARRTLPPERVQACDTLLDELAAANLTEGAEDELVRLMEAADANAAPCTEVYVAQARSPGERALAAHRGRDFLFHALALEASLSRRFDAMSGYCEIVADTVTLLFEGIADLEVTLTDPTLPDSPRRRLVELRDLDLEALDVFVAANERECLSPVGD